MRLADYLSRESEPLRSELERFFANFPADAPASPLTLPAGKFLIRQDDPCGAVYILLEGDDHARFAARLQHVCLLGL